MPCIDAGSSGFGGTRCSPAQVDGGRGRAREKAAIVAESYSGVETVCAVARRHGLRHSQLFTWRREFRQAAEATVLAGRAPAPPLFVPAIIEPEPAALTPVPRKRFRRSRTAAAIELEIEGVS